MSSIFEQIKFKVTARQVAESYGIKVSRNGMACCPFHNDKHPSMKIDQNYYCFACGLFYYSECGCTYRIDGNNDPCRIQDYGTSIVLRF